MPKKQTECLEKILKNIKAGKNSLIWKKNVFNYVEGVSKRNAVVYLNELAPIKSKLIQLITAIQEIRDRKVPTPTQFQRMTIDELKEMLFKKASGIKVVIVFNHFERLTPSTSRFWLSVSSHESRCNVQCILSTAYDFQFFGYNFICSINQPDMRR